MRCVFQIFEHYIDLFQSIFWTCSLKDCKFIIELHWIPHLSLVGHASEGQKANIAASTGATLLSKLKKTKPDDSSMPCFVLTRACFCHSIITIPISDNKAKTARMSFWACIKAIYWKLSLLRNISSTNSNYPSRACPLVL